MNVAASQTATPVGPEPNKELKALKKACEQFEAVFAKQLLGEMRKGVQEVKIGDQAGSDIYKDMMDQTIADSVAHQGALGIGQMLYKQFAKQVTAGAQKPEPSTSDMSLQTQATPAKQSVSDPDVQAATDKSPLTGPISFRERKLSH